MSKTNLEPSPHLVELSHALWQADRTVVAATEQLGHWLKCAPEQEKGRAVAEAMTADITALKAKVAELEEKWKAR